MVVVLGVALVACGTLARRYPIAPAILLVLVGVLVGFVPHLQQAQLPPEVTEVLRAAGERIGAAVADVRQLVK